MKLFFSKRKTHLASFKRNNPCSKASMEPLFFKAENASFASSIRRSDNALQWSRFFSKRKTFLETDSVR